MQSLSAFIRWSLLGALVAGTVTFAGFLIVCHHEMFTHDGDEVQAWTWFAAVMGSAGDAAIGFVLGGIYGVIRARQAPLLKVIGWSLSGALIGWTAVAALFICMRVLFPSTVADSTWNGGGDALYVGCLYGAVPGFVLGCAYRMRRADRR
jgi:hypothetical protein